MLTRISVRSVTELSGPYREANQAVEAAWPLWERLIEDEDPRVREAATGVLPACTGPAAAAHPLLAAELDQMRRHNNATYTGTNVPDDEELLYRCRAALAAIEPGA